MFEIYLTEVIEDVEGTSEKARAETAAGRVYADFILNETISRGAIFTTNTIVSRDSLGYLETVLRFSEAAGVVALIGLVRSALLAWLRLKRDRVVRIKIEGFSVEMVGGAADALDADRLLSELLEVLRAREGLDPTEAKPPPIPSHQPDD